MQTASRPLLTAMWVIGLGYMARVLQRQVEESFIDEVLALRDVALIVCVTWFLLRFIGKVCRNIIAARAARGEVVDHTTIDALGKLARLVTLIVAVLMTAQTLGFQITGLLALGGVGGIAVGFAAKDLLANFFGGLTIYLDRPFVVGEWIRSPDKAIEGTVEYISWRHTRIRGFNKNPIYVPNALFTNIVVENPSRMSHRRIKTTIGLRYDDFAVVAPIVADIKAMLSAASRQSMPTPTLIVNFQRVRRLVARPDDLHLHQDGGLGRVPRRQAGRAAEDRRDHRRPRRRDRVSDPHRAPAARRRRPVRRIARYGSGRPGSRAGRRGSSGGGLSLHETRAGPGGCSRAMGPLTDRLLQRLPRPLNPGLQPGPGGLSPRESEPQKVLKARSIDPKLTLTTPAQRRRRQPSKRLIEPVWPCSPGQTHL